METAAQIQMNVRQNSSELQDFLRDLGHWEKDVKAKDASLREKRTASADLDVPIRGSSRTATAKKPKSSVKTKENQAGKETSASAANKKAAPARLRAYDFRGWDKFDADKICEQMDEAEELQTKPQSSESEEDEESDEEEERLKQLAVAEKDRGNAFFKKGNYSAAIECYTKGIAADPENSLLPANRAMALLKQEKFGAALVDCDLALSIDPTYIKARMRRAAALTGLSRLDEAQKDYEEVLRRDKGNKQAMDEMGKLNASEPVKPTSASVKAGKPRRLRSQKPLHRMLIEEIGTSSDEDANLLSSVAVTTGVKTVGQRTAEEYTDVPATSEQTPIPNGYSSQQVLEPAKKTAQEVGEDEHGKSNLRHQPVETLASDTWQQRDTSLGGESNESAKLSSRQVKEVGVPKTSYQLSVDLSHLQHDKSRLYQYVKAIPPDSYSRIFRQSLDSSMLMQLLHVFSENYTENSDSVWDELLSLSQVQRFNTAIMLLSKADKRVIEHLFSYVRQSKSGPEVDTLEQTYGVS